MVKTGKKKLANQLNIIFCWKQWNSHSSIVETEKCLCLEKSISVLSFGKMFQKVWTDLPVCYKQVPAVLKGTFYPILGSECWPLTEMFSVGDDSP